MIFQPSLAGQTLATISGSGLKGGFQKAFSQGAQKAVAFLEAYSNSSSALQGDALRFLDHMDVVIGPCRGGGVYALGIRGPQDALINALDFTSPSLAEQVLHHCQRLNLGIWVMETRAEVTVLGGMQAHAAV